MSSAILLHTYLPEAETLDFMIIFASVKSTAAKSCHDPLNLKVCIQDIGPLGLQLLYTHKAQSYAFLCQGSCLRHALSPDRKSLVSAR